MFSGGIPFTPWGMAQFAAIAFTLLGSFPVFHAKTTKGFKQPSKRRTIAVFFIVMSLLSWGTYSVLSFPRWEARYRIFQVANTLPDDYNSGKVWTNHICGELGFDARQGFGTGSSMNLATANRAEFEDALVEIRDIASRLEQNGYEPINWFVTSVAETNQSINANFTRGNVDVFAEFSASGVSLTVNPTDCKRDLLAQFRLAFIDEPTSEQICTLATTPASFPLACGSDR